MKCRELNYQNQLYFLNIWMKQVRYCCRVLVVSTSEVAACMDLRAFMLNFASGRFMSM